MKSSEVSKIGFQNWIGGGTRLPAADEEELRVQRALQLFSGALRLIANALLIISGALWLILRACG